MRPTLAIALGVAIAGAVAPGIALAQTSSWSLVEATSADVKDISDEPGAPRICLNANCTIGLDGSWRVKFDIDRTLSGDPISAPVFRDQASARPRLNFKYLLVVVRQDGKQTIEWAGPRSDGLCMTDEDIRKFGLAKMAARMPCRR